MIRPLGLLLLSAAPAWAEVPDVLADTAPVHSLVAMVMGDLGEPRLIVPSGTSPHDASLAPSEAQALSQADLVVWTGAAFLPWLDEGIASLASEARVLSLLDTGGWESLPAPGGEGIDPHAWLDPDVAIAWLGHISSALSDADPENAETYGRNAADASERLASLKSEIQGRLGPLARTGYAVGHDAYGYFGRATGLPPTAAIAPSDGAEPSPSAVTILREAVDTGAVECLLLDPEADPAWAETLGEGTDLRTATVDPEGIALEPGPGLYPALISGMAEALATCLGG